MNTDNHADALARRLYLAYGGDTPWLALDEKYRARWRQVATAAAMAAAEVGVAEADGNGTDPAFSPVAPAELYPDKKYPAPLQTLPR